MWQMARMPFVEIFRLCGNLQTQTQQNKVYICLSWQISGYFGSSKIFGNLAVQISTKQREALFDFSRIY